MNTAIVTVKGQIVIPSTIRKRYGIHKGTRLCIIDEQDQIVLRPLTKDYFRKVAGILKNKKILSQEFLKERMRDKEREDKKCKK